MRPFVGGGGRSARPRKRVTAAPGPRAGSASQTLGALAQAVSGRVLAKGTASQTLGALTQATSGGVIRQGLAAQTLATLAQSASGLVLSGSGDADALAVINAMSPAPSTARAALITTLVTSLKTAGVWSKLTYFVVPRAHASQPGRIDWRDPSRVGVINGTVTFEIDRGFTGSGASGSYIATGYSGGTAEAQNDYCLFAWVETDAQSDAAEFGNRRNRIQSRTTSNIFATRNQNGGSDTNANTTGSGLFISNRTGASATELVRNKVLLKTGARASAAPVTEEYWLCGSNDTVETPTYSTKRVSFAGVSRTLTIAEREALFDALDAYVTATQAATPDNAISQTLAALIQSATGTVRVVGLSAALLASVSQTATAVAGSGGQVLTRPYGLGFTPSYVPNYSGIIGAADGVPANAVDFHTGNNGGAFASIGAWLQHCFDNDRPARIRAGTYSVDAKAAQYYLRRGLYGYDPAGQGARAVFVNTNTDFAGQSSGTPAWLYLFDTDVVLRGVEFRNFFTVLAGAVESVIRDGAAVGVGGAFYDLLTTDTYGFRRIMPVGASRGNISGTGKPLSTSYPRTLGTVGPAVSIAYCVFWNCENAFMFGSDSIAMGRFDLHECDFNGTWGGYDLNCMAYTAIYAAKNRHRNCVQSGPDGRDRRQASVYSNSVQTFHRYGAEQGWRDINLFRHHIYIENNQGIDVLSVQFLRGKNVNAAVFHDGRNQHPAIAEVATPGGSPTVRSSVQVSFNEVIRYKGLRGQEDCNAFYAKPRGMVFERNYIEDCGSADYSVEAGGDLFWDGCETSGILVKEPANTFSGDPPLVLRGNIFRLMPPNIPVVKTDNHKERLKISYNDFGPWTSNKALDSHGMLRMLGTNVDGVEFIGNVFDNCYVQSVAFLINFHSFGFSAPANQNEISNNRATGTYGADQQLIRLTGLGSPATTYTANMVTGRNVLVGPGGTYRMKMSSDPPLANDDAPLRVYTPPQA